MFFLYEHSLQYADPENQIRPMNDDVQESLDDFVQNHWMVLFKNPWMMVFKNP